MKIEVTVLIACLSLIIAGAGLFMNFKKNNKGDSVETGRVLEKLDNIQKGTTELKDDVRGLREDISSTTKEVVELRARLNAVEKTVYRNKNKEGDDK